MWWRIAALASWAVLGAAAGTASAKDTDPPTHKLPFQAVIDFHHVQPRRDELEALHISDLTPEELRTVERLYWELLRDDEPLVRDRRKHFGRRCRQSFTKIHRIHRVR